MIAVKWPSSVVLLKTSAATQAGLKRPAGKVSVVVAVQWVSSLMEVELGAASGSFWAGPRAILLQLDCESLEVVSQDSVRSDQQESRVQEEVCS